MALELNRAEFKSRPQLEDLGRLRARSDLAVLPVTGDRNRAHLPGGQWPSTEHAEMAPSFTLPFGQDFQNFVPGPFAPFSGTTRLAWSWLVLILGSMA